YMPELGSICSFTAKNKINTIPTQKAGKQYKTIDIFDIALSINFPRSFAAIAPSIVPTIIVIASLNKADIKVTFSFSFKISVTGASYVYDTPKSPCIMFWKYKINLLWSGSFKPYD